MRTFFATCGALALMIPVGLLQSENTNAQDGLRRTQNQTIRPFNRVRQYNACSSRRSAPVNLRRCGIDGCNVPECVPRLIETRDCRSGICGASNCVSCQASRHDFCDSPGSGSQQRNRTPQRLRDDQFDRDLSRRGFERSTSPPLRRNRPDPNRNQTGRHNEPRPDARFAPDIRTIPDAPQDSDQLPLPPGNRPDRNRRTSIQWRSDIRSANRESADTGLPILIKFSATWCGQCKRMKRETFTDPKLISMINECFIPIEVDTDRNEQLARQLRIESVPTTLVISPQGDIAQRREGFQSALQLQRVLAEFCSQPADRPLARRQPSARPSR